MENNCQSNEQFFNCLVSAKAILWGNKTPLRKTRLLRSATHQEENAKNVEFTSITGDFTATTHQQRQHKIQLWVMFLLFCAIFWGACMNKCSFSQPTKQKIFVY